MCITAVWLLGQAGYSHDAAEHGIQVLQRMHRKAGNLDGNPFEQTPPSVSERMLAVMNERRRYESLGLAGLAQEARRPGERPKRQGLWLVAAVVIFLFAGD